MKAIVFTALLATAALPLAAQEIIPYDDHFASTRTRAEVMAEVRDAVAAGHLYTQGEIVSYPDHPTSASMLSRAEVVAELARAQAAGELSSQNEITSEPPLRMPGESSRLARSEPAR